MQITLQKRKGKKNPLKHFLLVLVLGCPCSGFLFFFAGYCHQNNLTRYVPCAQATAVPCSPSEAPPRSQHPCCCAGTWACPTPPPTPPPSRPRGPSSSTTASCRTTTQRRAAGVAAWTIIARSPSANPSPPQTYRLGAAWRRLLGAQCHCHCHCPIPSPPRLDLGRVTARSQPSPDWITCQWRPMAANGNCHPSDAKEPTCIIYCYC